MNINDDPLTAWGEGALTAVRAMSRTELEVRLLDAWEALERLEESVDVADTELTEMRARMALVSECSNAVAILARDAKPLEFEHVLRDHAPFKNVLAAFFGKTTSKKKGTK